MIALNCRFWNNTADDAGALHVNGIGVVGQLRLINCSIAGNMALSSDFGRSGGMSADATNVALTNCILFENSRFEVDPDIGGPPMLRNDEAAQLDVLDGLTSVRNSCIQGLSEYASFGNIGEDPMFISSGSGNLRLVDASPCIDSGQNLVDTDPMVPGIQPLPEQDLDRNPRIVDGNLTGPTTVDMGAYEFQRP